MTIINPIKLGKTARRLASGPVAATALDKDALATLSELGLVARDRQGLSLNVTLAQGAAIRALECGDLRRAAGYARPQRSVA